MQVMAESVTAGVWIGCIKLKHRQAKVQLSDTGANNLDCFCL